MSLIHQPIRRFLFRGLATLAFVNGIWFVALRSLGLAPSVWDFVLQTTLPSCLVLFGIVGWSFQLRPVPSDDSGIAERRSPDAESSTTPAASDDSRDHQFHRLTETLELVLWEAEMWTWRFTYVSPHAFKLLGYPVQDWYEDDFWINRLHPDDRLLVIEQCKKTCAARESLELEYRMIRSDDVTIWVHNLIVVPKSRSGSTFVRGCFVDITKRKFAEQALRESEQRYRLLADSMEDVISLANADGTLAYVSPSYFRQTGHTWEDVTTTSYQNRVHPADWGTVEQARNDNCQGKRTRIEWRCKRKDGTYIWVETTANPIVDETGNVTQIACCTRDVTARKLAAQALRQSEERFRSVIEGSIQGIAIQQDWIIRYANPAMARMLGYESPEDVAGLDLTNFILPEYLPELREREQVFLNGAPVPVHPGWQLRRRDGRTIWVTSGGNRIRWKGRAAIVGFLLDITENKMAEVALRNSERRFRELFDYSPEAIFVEDLEGVILDVNPAACKLYQMPKDDLLGRKVDHIPPEQLEPPPGLTPTASEPITFERSCETFDGRVLPLEIRANLIEYNDGPAWLLLVGDATERKQLQEKLQQAEKMEAIGRVTRGVAHDFNNILMAINGYAHVLLVNDHLTQAVRSDIQEILKAVELARKLTRELVAFEDDERREVRRVDLNQLIRDLAKMFRALLSDGIELKLALPPLACELQAGPQDLERLLVNLVINARDAMPQGGQLTIATSEVQLDHSWARARGHCRPGPHVKLTIQDTGVGMTEEVRRHIFEPFFTTKGSDGTGLGLFNVYGIVSNHGGHINVKSRVGEGTTFELYLPACPQRPQPAALGQPGGHRGSSLFETVPQPTRSSHSVAGIDVESGNAPTILLVDDEAPVRLVSTRILEDEGYIVLSAADGVAALEMVRSHPTTIDLVITDFVMPRMSGSELVVQLRSIYTDLPVLFIGGCWDPSGALVAPEADFLSKPFFPQTLVDKVREILSLVETQADCKRV